MIAAAFTLGLVGLAASSPLAVRQIVPHYPDTAKSTGFKLVVNVTDPSTDFKPSIQNTYIEGIHTGAGLSLVGVGADSSRVFYQNGTADQFQYASSNVLSDIGQPLSPAGFQLTKKEGSTTLSTATLNVGSGTPGVRLSRFPTPYVYLLPETFVACNESLAYYQGKYFITISQADTTIASDGSIQYNIPSGCAKVRLVPECAQLPTLPAGSYSSHQYAIESQCYSNVSTIDWKQYGP